MTIDWNGFFDKEYKLENYLGVIWAHSELFDEITKENPKTILEVGTGRGIMSIFLSWMGYKVTAVDNNVKLLEKGRVLCRHLHGNVDYVFCDLFKLESCFDNRKFDLIFSQGLLEHFDDRQINELIRQQLKIANKIVISVPSVFYPLRDFGNERLLPAREWGKILRNFRLEAIKYYGFVPSEKSIRRSAINPFALVKIVLNVLLRRTNLIIKISN